MVYASARYYHRNLERHLFSASLRAYGGNRLDTENQVLLGGDNGLCGYPLRYQAGERSAILSVEQRFFTEWYPWRLFRVGYAAFVDAGRVWGPDPRAAPTLGTLYDLGVGLRLTSPRSSGRSVVHIDLAFPLNGDPTIDDVQLIVEDPHVFLRIVRAHLDLVRPPPARRLEELVVLRPLLDQLAGAIDDEDDVVVAALPTAFGGRLAGRGQAVVVSVGVVLYASCTIGNSNT